MQLETVHHLCWAWGRLARATSHTKAVTCLFGTCGSLRDVGKDCCMSRATGRGLGGASESVWKESQGITWAGQTLLARLMETQI